MTPRMRQGAWCGVVLAGCASYNGPLSVGTLGLPPTTQPVEVRAAAYSANQAVLDTEFWRGTTVARGHAAEGGTPAETRPWLAISPQAGELLSRRATLRGFGTLTEVLGVTAMVAGLSLLPQAYDYTGRESSQGASLGLVGVGLLGTITGAVLFGLAEQCLPRAVRAYNQWLWHPCLSRCAA